MLDFIGNKLRVASFRPRLRLVAGFIASISWILYWVVGFGPRSIPSKFGPRENLSWFLHRAKSASISEEKAYFAPFRSLRGDAVVCAVRPMTIHKLPMVDCRDRMSDSSPVNGRESRTLAREHCFPCRRELPILGG